MFYIENFALRLLFCIGTTLAAVLLVVFVKSSAAGVPFALDIIKHVVTPIALGTLAAVMWKPKER